MMMQTQRRMVVSDTKKSFWEAMVASISEKVKPAQKEPEIEAEEFLTKAKDCLDEKKTRHDRQALAAQLADKMRMAPEPLRGEVLAALAVGLGAEKEVLRQALGSIDWKDVDMALIEKKVASGIGARRRKLCQLWLSMDGALEFLVWLREQTSARAKIDQAIEPLKTDLDEIMGEIFAQGLLQMRPITWRTPALVLEKIMQYEQVHEMQSWGDLKSRLGRDRRVFAVFHSGWVDEPLAFLEVALTKGLAKSVAEIIEAHAMMDVSKADTATFYSINAPHAGLKGISFGEDLIKKAVQALREELPQIKQFCTLSPIPGFAKWLASLSQEKFETLCGVDLLDKLEKKIGMGAKGVFLKAIREEGWSKGPLGDASKDILEKMCAKYLSGAETANGMVDPVAKFHLGNGARVESLRHLADTSNKGMAQSHGMMVNYYYDLADLEKNKLSRGQGDMAASWSIRRLAKS